MLLTCHSFIPCDTGKLNAAGFCNPRIDAQVSQALALQPYGACETGWGGTATD
jgi:hypothetical protein